MEILKNQKNIEIKIDFANINYDKKSVKKIIRKLKNIRKKADWFKKTIKVQTIHKRFENIHTIGNPYEYDIYVTIQAIQIDDKKQRCEFLYNEICFYLDHICTTQNLCDFKDNQCFAKQNTDTTMGCCHHFPNKKWGMLYQKKLVPCEFLSEKGCTTKAIGCKLFMCDAVHKKGYKFTVYNVLLIRYFFNWIQKIIIKCAVFESKEKIMKQLLKFNF